MMKKLTACVICVILLLSVGVAAHAELNTFTYTQYASGGVPTELEAVILFENKNKTFTRYQVAFTSCTCRGPERNYSSVMYIELLNTKDTADEASIRQISFGEIDGVTVGLWGDSNPIMGHPDYTAEYMDENLVQPLVGTNKAQYDAWEGYGDVLDAVEPDAVSGATVSTSNITSVIKGLFQYHADKYYK
ncbi:MAG: hypothetical protein J5949_02445 [Oscillospiraceae bacterium]|nr:hypothetical protein [Oscillospiraceae bacterium]